MTFCKHPSWSIYVLLLISFSDYLQKYSKQVIHIHICYLRNSYLFSYFFLFSAFSTGSRFNFLQKLLFSEMLCNKIVVFATCLTPWSYFNESMPHNYVLNKFQRSYCYKEILFTSLLLMIIIKVIWILPPLYTFHN